ncbi:hypothetical protein MIDIC_240040 [Alphaproteobacteria bacterium]
MFVAKYACLSARKKGIMKWELIAELPLPDFRRLTVVKKPTI